MEYLGAVALTPILAGSQEASDMWGLIAKITLLPGRRDEMVEILAELPGEKRLEIIPGATHLFEEPGALESVAELAKSWFAVYLYRANQRTRTA